MNYELDTLKMELKDHSFGRFDKRMPIGPVQWNFHDLLWIHEGQVVVEFAASRRKIDVVAPGGVLILPNTSFSGRALSTFATASVCHFAYDSSQNSEFMTSGYRLPKRDEALHIQNLVRLAMDLASHNRENELPRRRRLLRSILDCFNLETDQKTSGPTPHRDRLATAWDTAEQSLAKMRTLSDVAGLININESGFRALHRGTRSNSAGDHLRALRLKKAEELLATTGFSIGEIAQQVGYAHAESFSAAIL